MRVVGHTARVHEWSEAMQQECMRAVGHTARVHEGSGVIQQEYMRVVGTYSNTWGVSNSATVDEGSGAIQQQYMRVVGHTARVHEGGVGSYSKNTIVTISVSITMAF